MVKIETLVGIKALRSSNTVNSAFVKMWSKIPRRSKPGS